jgi:hypothetical protein
MTVKFIKVFFVSYQERLDNKYVKLGQSWELGGWWVFLSGSQRWWMAPPCQRQASWPLLLHSGVILTNETNTQLAQRRVQSTTACPAGQINWAIRDGFRPGSGYQCLNFFLESLMDIPFLPYCIDQCSRPSTLLGPS